MMMMIKLISNVDSILIIRYTFTTDYYCFSDIYEEGYDLVRKVAAPGTQIVLLSHDSIRRLMYFKIIYS